MCIRLKYLMPGAYKLHVDLSCRCNYERTVFEQLIGLKWHIVWLDGQCLAVVLCVRVRGKYRVNTN